MSKTLTDIERLATAAEKVLKEIVLLRGDVDKLNGRIEPVDDWNKRREIKIPEFKPRRTVVDSLHMIEIAREHIFACEGEIGLIRARIDGIESDAISREEMKPYIKGR